AREDEQIPRLVPRAAPATAGVRPYQSLTERTRPPFLQFQQGARRPARKRKFGAPARTHPRPPDLFALTSSISDCAITAPNGLARLIKWRGRMVARLQRRGQHQNCFWRLLFRSTAKQA